MPGLMQIDMEMAVEVESGLDMERGLGQPGYAGRHQGCVQSLRSRVQRSGGGEREEAVGGKQMRKERLRKSKGGRRLCGKTSRRRWSAWRWKRRSRRSFLMTRSRPTYSRCPSARNRWLLTSQLCMMYVVMRFCVSAILVRTISLLVCPISTDPSSPVVMTCTGVEGRGEFEERNR
jgi:hypothetical protein